MDGRRRLAEPVTDGAPTRPAAGTAPEPRRVRARMRIALDLHVFSRCGHWAQWEHADKFNRMVGEFIAR